MTPSINQLPSSVPSKPKERSPQMTNWVGSQTTRSRTTRLAASQSATALMSETAGSSHISQASVKAGPSNANAQNNNLLNEVIQLLSLIGQKNDRTTIAFTQDRFESYQSELPPITSQHTLDVSGTTPPRQSQDIDEPPKTCARLRKEIRTKSMHLKSTMQEAIKNENHRLQINDLLPKEGQELILSQAIKTTSMSRSTQVTNEDLAEEVASGISIRESEAHVEQVPDLTDSALQDIQSQVLDLLLLQQKLEAAQNKRDFYPILRTHIGQENRDNPELVLLKKIQSCSMTDILQLPLQLDHSLNEKTKPMLQSYVDLSTKLVTEQRAAKTEERATDAHEFAKNADFRGEAAEKRAKQEGKIRFAERVVEQSAKRVTHKESILDTSYSNIWSDSRTQAAFRAILGIASLRAEISNNNALSIIGLWAPVATSLVADLLSVFFTAMPVRQSIGIERHNVSLERDRYETAGRHLAKTLCANAPAGASLDGLDSTSPLLRIKNGKPSNTNDVINARRLPPFYRVSQYILPFAVTLLSAGIAGIRHSNLIKNMDNPNLISEAVKDFIDQTGSLSVAGNLPGPFSISGTITP